MQAVCARAARPRGTGAARVLSQARQAHARTRAFAAPPLRICARAVSSSLHAQDAHVEGAAQAQQAPRGGAVVLRSYAVASFLLACSGLLPPSAHAGGAAVVDRLRELLPPGTPGEVVVLFCAALPLVELRGAIPLGLNVLGMEPASVFALACAGNMLPVPLILLALGPLARALSSVPALRRILEHVFERARNQGAAWGQGNAFWALALFVGVPLPGTGAWSGAFAAYVLGMPLAQALGANLVGVLIAGALMTTLSLLGWRGLWIASAVLLGGPLLALAARLLRGRPVEPDTGAPDDTVAM